MFKAPLLCFGPLIVVLAILWILKKIPPNAFVGIRTKKTCDPVNKDVWYRLHVYAGRQCLLAGSICTACIAVMMAIEESIPTAIEVILFCIGLGAVIAVLVRSLLYLRNL